VDTSLLDWPRIAREVARELRDIYGARLRDVVLYGSSARGDAQPDSDIDLLIVLDEVPSRQRELARMSDVLWRHSLSNDVVLSEIPISESEYQDHRDPLLERVRAEGVSVAWARIAAARWWRAPIPSCSRPRTLEEALFSAQATSRAYYAAFYAAEAALLSLGETRSKHSGVLSAFGLLVVKQGGSIRRLLLSCEDCSSCAASRIICGWMTPNPDDYDPIDAAQRFVDGVKRWLGRPADW
jgi:predicted nucleotidyltransferase